MFFYSLKFFDGFFLLATLRFLAQIPYPLKNFPFYTPRPKTFSVGSMIEKILVQTEQWEKPKLLGGIEVKYWGDASHPGFTALCTRPLVITTKHQYCTLLLKLL